MDKGRWRLRARSARLALLATGALPGVVCQQAAADTLEGALIQSYRNNPQLNAQRAATRATDEGVAIALGGYRPRVAANASIAEQHLEVLGRSGASANCSAALSNCGDE